MISVVKEVLIWSPNLLSQFDLNSVLSPSLLGTFLQHTEGGGRSLSGEGLHLGNMNSSGAMSPLTQFNNKFGWLSSVAHFCCITELCSGNNCSLGLTEETSRRGKEQRRVVSGCQASAVLEALAKMIGGEQLMMAILSLKTD